MLGFSALQEATYCNRTTKRRYLPQQMISIITSIRSSLLKMVELDLSSILPIGHREEGLPGIFQLRTEQITEQRWR